MSRPKGSKMKQTKIIVRGMTVLRYDFGDQEALIAWFLDNMLGRHGVASKVVGNTLLTWEKK